MTLRIEAGFDFAEIGAFDMDVTDSGGTENLYIQTGRYCHTDISSLIATNEYVSLGLAIQTLLNASATLSGTYTVTWVGSGLYYTIACTESFTLADFGGGDPTGTIGGALLGMDGIHIGTTYSGSGRHTPTYSISGASGCKSNPSDDYEPSQIAEGGYSSGGAHYSISAQTAIVFNDFDLQFEDKAATFKKDAATTVPWTYQHLWENVRGDVPFLVVDDVDSTVYYMRSDSAAWRPERAEANWDDAWHMLFRCILVGRL